MARKKIFDEYLEVKRIEDSLKEKKKLQKQTFISITTAIYVVIIALLMSNFSLVSKFFTPGSKFDERIIEMEKQIDIVRKQNEILQNSISNQNPDNFQYYNISNRINNLENSQKSLSDAVLLNPNDVITARLLSEKQKILEEQFISLKDSFQGVNDNLNKLFWAAILLPLIGLVWSFVKDKFLKKNDNDNIF